LRIQQITIIGTGLIGGSLALALRQAGFMGRLLGCDSAAVLDQALRLRLVEGGSTNPAEAVIGSDVVVLATPVGAIIDLVRQLGATLPSRVLLTDVGSTKAEVVRTAIEVMGKSAPRRFLAGHPMAGKETCGLESADARLFQDAAWFVTPLPGQDFKGGLAAEFLGWIEKIGARIATLDAARHDRLCAWISHVPQMISTAMAASLVEVFGEDLPLLEAGGRALREMTRISASPYSMWRDIALTNKKNIGDALWQLEQRLAHIRENLDTRELAEEFERAHQLKKY
jgi:prephenate dehydrogenase